MIKYTIKMLSQHYKDFQKFLHTNTWKANNVLALNPKELQQNNIQVIILDYDGVLAPYKHNTILAKQLHWLQNLVQYYGTQQLFILSNNPNKIRQLYFAKYFPTINFIIASHKKPYPNSILEIQKLTKCLPREILIIDDRLLTGCLAAYLAKIQACLITKPLINYRTHLIAEGYFSLLRRLERLLLRF